MELRDVGHEIRFYDADHCRDDFDSERGEFETKGFAQTSRCGFGGGVDP